MFYIEYSIFNPETLKVSGRIEKTFENPTDFIQWYRINKQDIYGLINVMRYNPKENEAKAQVYYQKLISCSLENVT